MTFEQLPYTLTLYHGTRHPLSGELRAGGGDSGIEAGCIFAARDWDVARSYALSCESDAGRRCICDDGTCNVCIGEGIVRAITVAVTDADVYVHETDADACDYPIHEAIQAAREAGASLALIDWDGETHDVILDPAIITGWTDEQVD